MTVDRRPAQAAAGPDARVVRLGPRHGTLSLLTGRDGLASRAGHDLTLQVDRWQCELRLHDRAGASPIVRGVDVTAEPSSLRVIGGTGGIKPLTDKDRATIRRNALDSLNARSPISFNAGNLDLPVDAGSASVSGAMTVSSQTCPISVTVTSIRGATGLAVVAKADVVQSQFGIAPYVGLFGALRVRDRVEVVLELTLADTDLIHR